MPSPRPHPLAAAVLLLVAVLPGAAALALEGTPELSGKNSRGEWVDIRPASVLDDNATRDYNLPGNRDLYQIRIYSRGYRPRAPREPWIPSTIHRDQRCLVITDAAGTPRRFECAADGNSPLAGVVYKIVPNKDPLDCDHESRYICVRGCNKEAPRIMKLRDWTCGI